MLADKARVVEVRRPYAVALERHGTSRPPEHPRQGFQTGCEFAKTAIGCVHVGLSGLRLASGLAVDRVSRWVRAVTFRD